jgi:cation diffusion facilitator CzcD-associated flavoprotein CzcO
LEKWRNDPEAYLEFRCAVEDALNSGTDFVKVGSKLHADAQKLYEGIMQDRLRNKPGVYEALKPNYPAGCRRLTPGPGYLNAIAKENVDYISIPIEKVTETGIMTNDGKLREVDTIICATGFDTSGKPRIPTYGLDGITLAEVYDPTPEAYLSICPARMPNYFIYLGPNGGPGTGSTIIMLEQVADYICKAVSKLQREGLKSMVPK